MRCACTRHYFTIPIPINIVLDPAPSHRLKLLTERALNEIVFPLDLLAMLSSHRRGGGMRPPCRAKTFFAGHGQSAKAGACQRKHSTRGCPPLMADKSAFSAYRGGQMIRCHIH